MSRETLHNLNTNTLIGNTDQRGTAWHFRASHQGNESNHYGGPVPLADVERRLFSWQAESRPVAVETPAAFDTMTHLSAHGLPVRWMTISGKQAISRSDREDGSVMGIFTDGYSMHQYREWLLTTVANVLDDDLSISSAGLLRDGAIAWVEVSVPESVTTPEGVTFRPNLLATTSFDGSISTTFKRTVTDVVCDNTRELALSERGQQHKVKHSRYSQARIAEARDALALVRTLADEFAAEIATLCAVQVSATEWQRFLDLTVPVADSKTGQALSGRSATMADTKRQELNHLYRHDPRVAPWAGTAHGVIQALNTYEHHSSIVRGTDRAERNMLRTVTGEFGNLDRSAWANLSKVLALA
jgi:phage/plasmid-like protein (TIGR03299 family)